VKNVTYVLISFLLILCIQTTPGQQLKLNDFGSIEQSKANAKQWNIKFIDNEFYLQSETLTLKGNESFDIHDGYLTLNSTHENAPTLLRVYNRQGVLLLEKKYEKVMNLKFSKNKKYGVFIGRTNIHRLNFTTLKEELYELNNFASVNNNGDLFRTSFLENRLFKNEFEITLNQPVQEIISLSNREYFFTKNSLFQISSNEIVNVGQFDGEFFQAIEEDDYLFFTFRERKGKDFVFRLYKIDESKKITSLEEKTIALPSLVSHEEIKAPLKYNESNFPFPIGNSYGEIQYYGGSPYLHPGVDFLGADNENVYAVKPGIIKAKITTGGAAYWRLAIAEEFTSDTTTGYLYAHLNQNSIPYIVGDTVNAGDFLGTLYPWGFADFTHIHFGRIKSGGTIWTGDWYTTNNPLPDVTNIKDTIPPGFENAIGNNQFAYRNESGIYLDQYYLSGKVRVISKSYDRIYSDWKVDIWKLSFRLKEIGPEYSEMLNRFAFAFDMPLDVYRSQSPINDRYLKTIYSTDPICYSIGNYNDREYFHIISSSNGDSENNIIDSNYFFDTRKVPNGDYELFVKAVDASLNETEVSDYLSIINDAPATPTLVAPINGDTVISGKTILNFSASVSASTYLIQISTDETFSSVDSQFIVNINQIALPFLESDRTYFWRVAAQGTEGTSHFSQIGKFYLSTSTSIDEQDLLSFYLSQNYPNPFNPSTKIKFIVPHGMEEGELTSLIVYDLLGNEIAQLVNEAKDPGLYEVEFDSNTYKLSTGVYFYKLKVGTLSSIKKIVLIK
jgi:murein DD-endopeptidase MepM/ murein hydrolase activator NlpD